VLPQHRPGRKRLFLSSRNSIQSRRLQKGGRELRSGSAEFSQRKQGCRRSAQKGIRAAGTRKTRRGHTGIVARHPALSPLERSYTSSGEIAEGGAGAKKSLARVERTLLSAAFAFGFGHDQCLPQGRLRCMLFADRSVRATNYGRRVVFGTTTPPSIFGIPKCPPRCERSS